MDGLVVSHIENSKGDLEGWIVKKADGYYLRCFKTLSKLDGPFERIEIAEIICALTT